MISPGFFRLNAPWLIAGALLTLTSSFGQTFFISLFAGQIRSEFSLSHGQWGGIYSAGTLASAALMLWAGVLTDRFRARTLGTVIFVLLAVACLMMAGNRWTLTLVAVIFALRFTGQGMASHIAMVAMARWFVATRGRALAVAGMGFSIGEAFFPMLFVALFAVMPWRGLWLIAAVLSLCAIPVLRRLLVAERTPQSHARNQASTGMGGRHWTRRQALGHWLFWLCLPTILSPSMFSTALFFQQVHLVEVKGWPLAHFVALFPIHTGGTIVAMLISGWAIDRWNSAYFMPVFLLPMTVGFLVLSFGSSLSAAAIALALIGVMQGANATLAGAFWAEHFGTRHLGAIKALAASSMVFGSALGPGVTGYLIDAGVSFETQMIGISALTVVAALLAGLGIVLSRPLMRN